MYIQYTILYTKYAYSKTMCITYVYSMFVRAVVRIASSVLLLPPEKPAHAARPQRHATGENTGQKKKKSEKNVHTEKHTCTHRHRVIRRNTSHAIMCYIPYTILYSIYKYTLVLCIETPESYTTSCVWQASPDWEFLCYTHFQCSCTMCVCHACETSLFFLHSRRCVV